MFRAFFTLLAYFGLLVSSLSSYELSIGSMFRNEAPYLKEWVEYHHLAGVEHFWLYNNGSTDNWEEMLEPYIQSGIVEVAYWPTPPDSSYIIDQIEAFKDAIDKAKGKSKWIALVDLDEFIVPMKGSSIPDCLNTFFSDQSAIYVNWRNFGTSHVHIPKGEPILFQLTASSLPSHSDNGVGKSIVRPEAVDLPKVWYLHHFPLVSDIHYVNGNRKKMAFNGIDLPSDGKHYDNFIRINHYVLRDENYYRDVRLARANRGNGNKELLLEHYDSFLKAEDYSIIEFIQKNFPLESQKLWRK